MIINKCTVLFCYKKVIEKNHNHCVIVTTHFNKKFLVTLVNFLVLVKSNTRMIKCITLLEVLEVLVPS